MNAEFLRMRAQMGGYAKAAKGRPDQQTRPYERQVDPNGELDAAERARRAKAKVNANLVKARYARSLKVAARKAAQAA